MGCCTLPAMPQPTTLSGMVKWVSAFGWLITINGDGGCGWYQLLVDCQPKSVGLIWESAATGHSVCSHQMNQVNFCTGSEAWKQHHKYRLCYYYHLQTVTCNLYYANYQRPLYCYVSRTGNYRTRPLPHAVPASPAWVPVNLLHTVNSSQPIIMWQVDKKHQWPHGNAIKWGS